MCRSFLPVLLSVLIIGCAADQSGELSDKIVLKVANVGITEYEFNKNLKLFQGTYQGKYGVKPGTDSLKKWKLEFIDRTYFLADAYSKGYDTVRQVQKQVENMGRMVLAQSNGPLEQRIVRDAMHIDEDEIVKAIDRSRKKITIKYLKFNDFDKALYAIGGKAAISVDEFNSFTKLLVNPAQQIVVNELTLVWPFKWLWESEEYLYSLKEGDITPLMLFSNGSFIIHVIKVEMDSLNNTYEYRKQIMKDLESQKAEKILLAYRSEMRKETDVMYNVPILEKFVSILNKTGPVNLFALTDFESILNENFFIYKISGDEIKVSVKEFITRSNDQVLRMQVQDSNDVLRLIESQVQTDYAYKKASTLGVLTDKKYLLDRANYKKQMIYNYYEMKFLKNKVSVSENEITDWYTSHKETYTQPTDVVVSLYSLKNEIDAYQVKEWLLKNLVDSVIATNDVLVEENLLMNYQKDVNRQKLVWYAMQMKTNDVIGPLLYRDKYFVIHKKREIGKRIQAIVEIKDIVTAQVMAKKTSDRKKEILFALKNTYELVSDVDKRDLTMD
jgi:hypothetical protein